MDSPEPVDPVIPLFTKTANFCRSGKSSGVSDTCFLLHLIEIGGESIALRSVLRLAIGLLEEHSGNG